MWVQWKKDSQGQSEATPGFCGPPDRGGQKKNELLSYRPQVVPVQLNFVPHFYLLDFDLHFLVRRAHEERALDKIPPIAVVHGSSVVPLGKRSFLE